MVKIIMVMLLLSNFYKCEKAMDNRYAVYLENNANHPIGCYFGLGGNFGTMYPDTTLPKSNQYIINEIKASSRSIYDSGIKWEEIFEDLPQDTMSVYIFHTDTLNKYTWEEVRNGYMILKRYDLSLEDLESMNWTITYP
jgi:hypothetical protein